MDKYRKHSSPKAANDNAYQQYGANHSNRLVAPALQFRRKLVLLFASIVLLLMLGAACQGSRQAESQTGSSNPADLPGRSSATIKAERGGTVKLKSGVVLEIPPGALPEDTSVTVVPLRVDDLSNGGFTGVRFEPDGTELIEPAVVRFPLPADWNGGAPLVYSGPGSDPTEVYLDWDVATLTGSPGAYVAEAPVYHFSTKVLARNCHAGTITQILKRYEALGCDTAKAIAEVNKRYPKINLTEASGCSQTDVNTVQALLDTYFEVRGTYDPGVPVPDADWAEALQATREGRMVVVTFGPWQWGARSGENKFFAQDAAFPTGSPYQYAHTAVLEDTPTGVQMRNTVSVARPPVAPQYQEVAVKHKPLIDMYQSTYGNEEVFYYYPAEKLNEYRDLPFGVALEQFWGESPGAFSDPKSNQYGLKLYNPIRPSNIPADAPGEYRIVPYRAVIIYMERAGTRDQNWSLDNLPCPGQVTDLKDFTADDCPPTPCDAQLGEHRLYRYAAEPGRDILSAITQEMGVKMPTYLLSRPMVGLTCEYKTKFNGEWAIDLVEGPTPVLVIEVVTPKTAEAIFPYLATWYQETNNQVLVESGLTEPIQWTETSASLVGDWIKKVAESEVAVRTGIFQYNNCVFMIGAGNLKWNKEQTSCVFGELLGSVQVLCR